MPSNVGVKMITTFDYKSFKCASEVGSKEQIVAKLKIAKNLPFKLDNKIIKTPGKSQKSYNDLLSV